MCLTRFATQQQARKHLLFLLFCDMKVLKVSHENQSGSVLVMTETVKKAALAQRAGQQKDGARETRQGKRQKDMKKDGARDTF